MKHFIFIISLSCIISCGSSSGIETGLSGQVTINSSSYTASEIKTNAVTVSDFKFCITKVQLKNSEGSSITSNGESSIEAILGLVDVSTATSSATWGTVTIPTGFTLGELSFEIHTDAENCSGAEYSASFNGTTITKDLEFKFVFNPAVELEGNDTLVLALDTIATAFANADAAGKLNNEEIAEYLTSETKGTGTKE